MQKVRLGDIAILINGDRGKNYPSQVDITNDGEVPFVNAGHLNGREIAFDEMNYISKDKYEKLSSGKFQEGDILYCLRGSIGKKAIVSTDIKGAIASSLVIIRPNSEKLYGEYLMLALESPAIKKQLTKANNGSSQPNLSAASVREYEIELPELLIQREVVEKLVKVRDIIDNRRQELQLLDDLIKARFVEMFGDVKYGIERWGGKPFKDIAINLDSKRKPVKDADRKKMQGIYPYYGATGIVDYVNDYRQDGEFLLISEDGKALELRSKPIAFLASGKIWINNHAHVQQCTDECNIIYLMYHINFMDVSIWVTGIDQKKLNRANLNTIPIALPPIELQKQFADFVKQVDKSKVLSETHIFYAEKSITPTTPEIFLKGRCIYGNEF